MTLGFLFGSKNFCELLWVSCEVFVLHGYAWIHWVAKSCTTTANRWLFRDSHPSLRTFVICCNQITKIFSTKYGSANASSARSPCNFGPFTDLAISVALKTLLEENWRVSLLVQEFHHPPNFLWILAATPGFQNTTGCPDPSSTFVDTLTGEMSLSIRSSRSQVSLPLDVTVGDEDELEEDVEQWLSCLESVLEVDWSQPEDELADKPGTTIGTKFSVLQCNRIPF